MQQEGMVLCVTPALEKMLSMLLARVEMNEYFFLI